jgi:hypothetical protein
MTKFAKFLCDDTGAVTIDWAAMTSGLLLLGIVVVYAVFDHGASSLVADLNNTLASTVVGIGSEQDPSGDGGDGRRTGHASDRACAVTAMYVVCMGPK